MRKKNGFKYSIFFYGILDILALTICFLLAFRIKDYTYPISLEFNTEYKIILALWIPTWIIVLYSTNLAKIQRTSSQRFLFLNFFKSAVLSTIIIYILIFILSFSSIRPIVIFLSGILSLIVLFSIRIIFFKFLKRHRVAGHNVSNILLIVDDSSEELIGNILKHKEWGYRIIMMLSNSEKIKEKFGSYIKIISEKANVKSLLDIDIIDEVFYAKQKIDEDYIKNLISICSEIGVSLKLKYDMSTVLFANSRLTHIEKTPFLSFRNTPPNSLAMAWKNMFDFFAALSVLLILSPVLLIVSILIKINSKGPVIFKQERVGLRGRKFYIYKFRTMVQNAEELKKKLMEQNESDGPTFKIKKDPRITPIGRFLRKTSLDELPQLFNILKGEMTLIGPRPPIPSEVAQYERWQLRRLSVKPGLTCSWQITPNRNEVLFEDWMKLDMQYIDNWSLKSDILLFFKTIKAVISNTGY